MTSQARSAAVVREFLEGHSISYICDKYFTSISHYRIEAILRRAMKRRAKEKKKRGYE